MFKIGLRLKKIREKLGISQAEMARRMAVARNVYWRIERGLVPSPRLNTVEDLCAALGVTLSEFFEEEDVNENKKMQ